MSFNTLPANPFPPSSEQMGAGGGGGSYVLPTASADTLGGVKVGSNLSIAEGVLSAPAPYSLPTASADTLGGVKVGSGLSIDDGVLSASGGSIPDYSTTEHLTGQKWIDGKDIYEITYDFSSSPIAAGGGQQWQHVSAISTSGIDKLISCFCIDANGNSFPQLYIAKDSNELNIANPWGTTINMAYITICYTKTSV